MTKKKYSTLVVVIVLMLAVSFYSCYSLNKNTLSDGIPAVEGAEYDIDGHSYEQIIHCDNNGLDMIHVLFLKDNDDNIGNVSFELADDGGAIQNWNVQSTEIIDQAYHTLILDKVIEDSKGKDYILKINSERQSNVSVAINSSGDYSGLREDGIEKEGQSLCYQLVYNNLKNITARWILFRFLTICVISVIIWLLSIKLQFNIVKTFLVLWCTLSLLYACSLTLFNTPDEYPHFYRTYDVSLGHLSAIYNEEQNAGGNELPFENVDLTVLEGNWQSYEMNKSKIQLSETMKFQDFSNTAVYAPISYFPQAVGIFFARHMTKNVAIIAYVGRFTNWLCITCILLLAFKMLPFGKQMLALICLIPMNIHQAISLSPDGMVLAISTLLVAVVLHLLYVQRDKLSKKQILALYMMGIAISLYKIVYLPFCLAYLLIPKERFNREMKGKIFHAACIIVIVGSLSVLWLGISGQFLVIPGTNPDAQTQFILSHPLHYILVIWRTYMGNSVDLLYMMMGRYLGWLTIKTNEIFLIVFLFMLIRKMNVQIRVRSREEAFQKCIWALLVLAIVVLTSTSLYIQFTPAYQDSIAGIQGRYFLPLLFPVYLLLTGDSDKTEESFNSVVSGTVLMTNLCVCVSVVFACLV